MARQKSDASEFIPFPTRFPKDILDEIKAQAAEGRRPINTQILILIEQSLAQHDDPPARPKRTHRATATV
jgi:hypothetical protein